jgi:hypothetical protein
MRTPNFTAENSRRSGDKSYRRTVGSDPRLIGQMVMPRMLISPFIARPPPDGC